MKKLLMGALLVLMMFALVGCGEKAGGTSTSGNNSTNSGSSNTNKFKGTTWVYEESFYDEYNDGVVIGEYVLEFKTASSGTFSEGYYIDSVLLEGYKWDFEYTVQSSTTCILVGDGGDEYKCEISGSKLYFYDSWDDSLLAIFNKK